VWFAFSKSSGETPDLFFSTVIACLLIHVEKDSTMVACQH
jgi:hypothetical protein